LLIFCLFLANLLILQKEMSMLFISTIALFSGEDFPKI